MLIQMSENQCSICLSDDVSVLIQLCENCKPSLTCLEDLNKYINGYHDGRRMVDGYGFTCMICKKDVRRLKYFFAGKMEKIIEDGCDWLPNNRIIMRQIGSFKNLEEPIKYEKYNTYIVVGPCLFISTYTCDECGGKVADRKGHYPMQCEDCDNGYDDHGDYCDIYNGFTLNKICLEKTSEENRKILNKRNKEMIMNCDVFSLKINQGIDCERAKVEFGQAEILGKILLIYFDGIRSDGAHTGQVDNWIYLHGCGDDEPLWSDDEEKQRDIIYPKSVKDYEKYFDENNIDYQIVNENKHRTDKNKQRNYKKLYYHRVIYLPEIKKTAENLKKKYSEFYLYIQDCLDSIEKLDRRMKELIIYCHPELSRIFKGGYKEYVSYLKDIISYKTI